ncbi:ABC transporter ATP-binding protein [uncultured Marinococcus sp.]|uniref:ABC transporter ATP-binding protein n=1 Tax=uncultured Marinococcus sp. TaxID=487012 RepID=UPI002602DA9C|nr:ABC transporter ATP-binding protein [uncultured Marinococcus sp.]
MKKRWITSPFQYKHPDIDPSQADGRPDAERIQNWKRTTARLWSYLAVQKWRLTAVFVCVLFTAAFMLSGPLLLGHIVDQYLVPQQLEGLGTILLLLFAVYVGWGVMSTIQTYMMISLAQQAVFKLRYHLFSHLQTLPLSFFDKRQHGSIMSRMTNDMDNISTTLNTSVVQIMTSLLTFTGILVIMLVISPLLTFFTLLFLPVMFFGLRWITRRTRLLFQKQQQAVGAVNGYAEETISGQSIVKVFSKEPRVMKNFEQESDTLRHAGFWAQTYSGFIPKWMNFLNNINFAVTAGAGGILAYYGVGAVTIGTIVIFVEYSRQFTRPLSDLANQFNALFAALAGAERIFSFLDEKAEDHREKEGTAHTVSGEVEFQDVSFGYENEKVLRGIDFHVNAGETAAFIGPTGSGKTTVMNLIIGFYTAEAGEVYVDHTPLSEWNIKHLRQQMSVVLQDDFLFEKTVMENIRYGNLDASDEEVIEAAKAANAHAFIERLPEGYQTMLGKEGSGFSHGQRQLLSIAKAVLSDPKILILDEATSSVDTVTEMRIQEALGRLMKGRTSFVVAHRLNTIEKADIIYVMDNGEIAEQGTHSELLRQQGRYAAFQQANQQKVDI